MTVLLTVCEIFSRIEVENRHFCPLCSDCRPLAKERPAISTYLYIAEKYIFIGYSFVADNV